MKNSIGISLIPINSVEQLGALKIAQKLNPNNTVFFKEPKETKSSSSRKL